MAFSEVGTIGKNLLTLQWQPGRIDWLWNIKPTESDSIPALETLEVSNKAFMPLIERWLTLKSCPPAKRLALGWTLLHPVQSKKEVYAYLGSFLKKSVKLSENSGDFFYQINRKRKSTSNLNLEINRLSKWTAVKFQKVSVRISPDSISKQASAWSLAAKVEFDINSIPSSSTILKPKDQKVLFKEFCHLALELSEKGDIR
jgi:hypothetical protein